MRETYQISNSNENAELNGLTLEGAGDLATLGPRGQDAAQGLKIAAAWPLRPQVARQLFGQGVGRLSAAIRGALTDGEGVLLCGFRHGNYVEQGFRHYNPVSKLAHGFIVGIRNPTSPVVQFTAYFPIWNLPGDRLPAWLSGCRPEDLGGVGIASPAGFHAASPQFSLGSIDGVDGRLWAQAACYYSQVVAPLLCLLWNESDGSLTRPSVRDSFLDCLERSNRQARRFLPETF